MDIACHDREINMYKILAAHIIDTLGRIPAIGDGMTLCGLHVSVAAMEGNRIRKVRIEKIPEDEEEARDGG